jgi:hypothetical protein
MLSFEFYGGLLSLDFLRSLDPPVPIEQAENVAEAVIRHREQYFLDKTPLIISLAKSDNHGVAWLPSDSLC